MTGDRRRLPFRMMIEATATGTRGRQGAVAQQRLVSAEFPDSRKFKKQIYFCKFIRRDASQDASLFCCFQLAFHTSFIF